MTLLRRIASVLIPVYVAIAFLAATAAYFAFGALFQSQADMRLQLAVNSWMSAFSDEPDRPNTFALEGIDLFALLTGKQIRMLQGEFALTSETRQRLQRAAVKKEPVFLLEKNLRGFARELDEDTLVFAGIFPETLVKKRQAALGWILMAATALLLVLLGLSWLAYRYLAAPLHRLQISALRLCGGDYSQKIEMEGSREIRSLANAFTILQASLQDHLKRLHESKIARELLYGEQECAFFLQHQMLDAVVDAFVGKFVELRSISVHFGTEPWGLLLAIREEEERLILQLTEAKTSGFTGIYTLLKSTQRKEFPHLQLTLQIDRKKLALESKAIAPPLVWSSKQKRFVSAVEANPSSGDYLFLYNRGLAELMESSEFVPEWVEKVLRHFSDEGLASVAFMLQQELQFIARSSHITHDLHLICIRISV